MRETHRRVEINLFYEILYNLLDESLVYNRAERVTLLQKAILEVSQLRTHNQLLIKQLKDMDQYPILCPRLMLNSSGIILYCILIAIAFYNKTLLVFLLNNELSFICHKTTSMIN